jgi:PAS domain S-box-containing protein
MHLQGDTMELYPTRMAVSITNEKKVILDNILRAVIVTGVALNIIAAIRDYYAGLSISNALINSFFLLFLIGISVLGKKMRYEIKTWILVLTTIFMGCKIIMVNGIQIGTFYFFLVASIVSLLILKRKTAFYTIFFLSILYLSVLTLMAFKILTPAIDSAVVSIKIKWVGEICNYFFMLFIIIGGVGRMQRTFINTIEDLDESNQKLNQYNEELTNQLEQIKEMERKVTQTEINFKKLFEESNDGIIVCDADGVIIESNNAIAEMLEYPKTYLIGNKASDFVTSDDKRTIDSMAIEKINRAKIRELHLISRSGARIPIEINYSPITLKEQRVVLVTVRDIRERKQTEQKVLNAVIQAEENERSRFAKDLHDDLGPILSSIKMYIQSLRTHEDSEDKKELVND